MSARQQQQRTWRLVAVAVAAAIAFVGLVATNASADGGARQPRFGVTMALSATRVAPGTAITASGRVRDPQAVGREILFLAWNGVHFAPIARGVVATDRSYRMAGVVTDNTTVLVKLRKRYHIRRAGYSPRTVVHVVASLVSAPVTDTPTASDTPTCETTVHQAARSAVGKGYGCEPTLPLPTCTPTIAYTRVAARSALVYCQED